MPWLDEDALLLRLYLDYRSLTQAAQLEGASLGGRFVLLCEAEAAGRAGAARLAGAATLLVVPGREQAKRAVRAGFCDFLVTDLDEALRILKNELRLGAAAGVCLCGEPAAVLEACVARGVQPDLLDAPEPVLMGRGATVVRWQAALQQEESAVVWRLSMGPLDRMRALDAAASLLVGDEQRRGWLARAPLLLGRRWQRVRLLPMRDEELARFLADAARVAEDSTLTIERNGEQVWPLR